MTIYLLSLIVKVHTDHLAHVDNQTAERIALSLRDYWGDNVAKSIAWHRKQHALKQGPDSHDYHLYRDVCAWLDELT